MFNQHCSLEMQKHAVSLALLGTECAVVLRLHLLIWYRQHLNVTTVDISNLVNPLFYKVRPRWRRKAPQEACCTPPPSCAGWRAPWPWSGWRGATPEQDPFQQLALSVSSGGYQTVLKLKIYQLVIYQMSGAPNVRVEGHLRVEL